MTTGGVMSSENKQKNTGSGPKTGNNEVLVQIVKFREALGFILKVCALYLRKVQAAGVISSMAPPHHT